MEYQVDKYKGFKAELAIVETFEELKLLESKSAAVAEFAKKENVGIDEQNEWGDFRVEIAEKKGIWLDEKFPKGGDRKSNSTYTSLKEEGITFEESVNARLIAKQKELVKKAKEKIKKARKIITPAAVAKEVKKELKVVARAEKAQAGKDLKIDVDFRLGDFEKVLDDIPDGSVDCIITDPPYPIEFIECWSKLSRFAARKLKPNGFCIAYSGQMNLPEVINRMKEHLDYYWTFCLYHAGGTQIVNGVNIMCRWKPVLIYQNGKKKIQNTIQDYFISDTREKAQHDWQQSYSGINYVIEMFTVPGDLIVDPFAGGATTVKAALIMKRNIIAAELNETTFNIAKERLHEFIQQA